MSPLRLSPWVLPSALLRIIGLLCQSLLVVLLDRVDMVGGLLRAVVLVVSILTLLVVALARILLRVRARLRRLAVPGRTLAVEVAAGATLVLVRDRGRFQVVRLATMVPTAARSRLLPVVPRLVPAWLLCLRVRCW